MTERVTERTEPEFATVREAAEIVGGISAWQLWDYAKRGELRTYRPAGKGVLRVRLDDVRALMRPDTPEAQASRSEEGRRRAETRKQRAEEEKRRRAGERETATAT